MKAKDRSEYNIKRIGRFILLFIVIIFLLSNGSIRDKFSSFVFKTEKTLEIINEFDIELLKEYELSVIDNKINIYSNKGIFQYNFKGIGQLIKEVPLSNSIVKLEKEHIYITNSDTGEIRAFNQDGLQRWSKNLDKKVDYVLAKENYLVVISSTNEGYQEISILSSQGDSRGNLVLKNGQVVSVEAYDSFDELLIATIDVFEQQLVSSLIKYSKEGNVLWVETFENEMIQDVKYLEDKSCILVTDKKIYHLNEQKELLWSRENRKDIWDIRVDNVSRIIIILSKGNLETVNFNGRTINKIGLNEDFERVQYDGETVYLQNSKKILGIDGNNIFLKYSFDGEIRGIVVSDGKIILVLNDKIRIMSTYTKN